jgi:hypothetical protein
MGSFVFLVVFAAIFVLFADEMTAFFKKKFAIPWVRLFVPLFLISFFWVWHDEFLPLALAWLQAKANLFVGSFAVFLPHSIQWVARALGLYVLGSVPAWILYWHVSRQMTTKKNTHRVARLYVFAWMFFVLLFVM